MKIKSIRWQIGLGRPWLRRHGVGGGNGDRMVAEFVLYSLPFPEDDQNNTK